MTDCQPHTLLAAASLQVQQLQCSCERSLPSTLFSGCSSLTAGCRT